MQTIELRSDTVTKPTKAMLETMMTAEVGDDVYGEDPTVNALQEKAAKMFGMEAALFCPSGTMTNQIAIKIHTQPGDEVVCDRLSHIYNYEGGGIAYNSMASVRLIHGDNGKISPRQLLENINEDNIHFPRTKLVSLENTVNKAGGTYYTLAEIEPLYNICTENGLKLHLDGARLFNALVETGESTLDYGKYFHTISICLSKGLGAPVGSLLLGSNEDIYWAKRIRKVFGGGWRQAGFLAAAGIYALDNHINRLLEDHIRAKTLAKHFSALPYIQKVYDVPTNIVIVETEDAPSAQNFIGKLKENNILVSSFGQNKIRMVTHLDFDDAILDRFIDVLNSWKV
ncbi:MAG: threonine aldolase family protein [Bacteroidia bacterium]